HSPPGTDPRKIGSDWRPRGRVVHFHPTPLQALVLERPFSTQGSGELIMSLIISKTRLALASSLAAAICSAISTAQTWSAGTNFPVTMVRAAGVWFAPNGKFYAMGGRISDTAGSDLMNPYEYDPVAATWTVKAAAFPDNQNNNMVAGVLIEAGTPYIFCV